MIVILFSHAEDIIYHNVLGYYKMIVSVQTLHLLISYLMQHHSSQDTNTLNDYIKLFLASCHCYESSVGLGNQTTPFWYCKSNFVSLLNRPQQVEEHGAIYLYWEGVQERFIQHVKLSRTNMRMSVSCLVKK